MNKYELKKTRYERRKKHIRKRISGTADRLRLTVNRSSQHIYAQIINDEEMHTVAAASTLDKEIREKITPGMKKIDQSRLVGEVLAKRAVEKNITNIAFDRNGFLYHGRIKALADGARKGGLNF
jgi:large subunit ribosomal protein L18